MNTDILKNKELFDEKYAQVLPWRKNKIDKYKYDSDKRLSLGCSLLLNRAESDLHINPKTEEIEVNEFGKPFFKKHPEIHFNLSHSSSMAMCAISSVNIGCDIEKTDKIRMNIVKRFFSPEEQLALKNSQDKDLSFYEIWTRKESYVKMLGTGLNTAFESFNSFDSALNCFFYQNNKNNYVYCCCLEKKINIREILINL